jgi:hypothetical protein
VPTETTCIIEVLRLFSRHENLIPKDLGETTVSMESDAASQSAPISRQANRTPDIRLASQVLLYVGADDGLGDMVRKVSIDRLQNEGSRIGVKALPPGAIRPIAPNESLPSLIISELLRPKQWKEVTNHPFQFNIDYIKAICEEVESILAAESTVIRLRAPVKIYGDLYGQYTDLLRLFDMWGAPSENV